MSEPEPIQDETRESMNMLAKAIDTALNGPRRTRKPGPRKWGFALLVFRFGGGDGNRTNYVSNADRSEMLLALKELVARWEGRVVRSETRQ